MIIIQHYRESYRKEYRHVRYAKRRNQVPLIAEIPKISTEAAIIVHRRGCHWISSMPTPDNREECVDVVEPMETNDQYEGFFFKIRDGVLHATFKHVVQRHGFPIRKAFRLSSPVFKLKPGETLQFRINGRNSDGGDEGSQWNYLRHVINFAYDEFDPTIFKNTEFKRIVDLEAPLK